MLPLIPFNSERLIHSFKTVIACIIGLIVAFYINKPPDPWILVTIIVVMCAQLYVGSVFQKAYLRFLGTLVGCAFATLTLVLFGHHPLTVAIAVSIASFIFSYIAVGDERLSVAGTLGAVTTVIILITTSPSPTLALHRLIEISTGIFIATCVSQFILPIHARSHLRKAQAQTLKLLKEFYLTQILNIKEIDKLDSREIDENIVKSITKQRQLAKESMNELFGAQFKVSHFEKVLYCEKKVLRAIDMMRSAIVRVSDPESIFINSDALQAFHKKIEAALNLLIWKLQKPSEMTTQLMLLPNLDLLKSELKDRVGLSQNDIISLAGLIMAAGILIENLKRLAKLYEVPVQVVEKAS